MSDKEPNLHADKGKQDFSRVYNQPDPRAYYQTLAPLDYRIPKLAAPIFRRCLEALTRLRGKRQLTVVDLCCGYGVGAALLNHDIALDELYDRYQRDDLKAMSPRDVAMVDRAFFRLRRLEEPHRFVGIDIADQAIAYTRASELMDHAFARNLEEEPLGEDLASLVAEADLVTIIGGVGYITPTTITKLLDAGEPGRRPWVATLPLRTVPYGQYAESMRAYDLKTETWKRATIPQRQFANDGEREKTMSRLDDLDIEPDGLEERGYSHARFQLSRPAAEQRKVPLSDLVRVPAQAPWAADAERPEAPPAS